MRYIGRKWTKGGSDKFGGIAMDSLITAAARALASGDSFGALNRVALRDDAPGLHLAAIGRRKLYPQQSRVQVRTTCRSKTPTAQGPVIR